MCPLTCCDLSADVWQDLSKSVAFSLDIFGHLRSLYIIADVTVIIKRLKGGANVIMASLINVPATRELPFAMTCIKIVDVNRKTERLSLSNDELSRSAVELLDAESRTCRLSGGFYRKFFLENGNFG